MRDLVLTKEFKNTNIKFASLKLDGHINHKVEEAGLDTIWLRNNTRDWLVNVIIDNDINLIVIDNYDIDYEYEKYIKDNTNVIIMILDDTYKRHYCDILLNHNIYAKKEKYKNLVPKECEIRCGREYTLIRSEFVNTKRNPQNNIFIAMGGSDPLNINVDILKCLDGFLDLHIDIVTTSANKNIAYLEEYIKTKNNITLNIDSPNLAILMAKSKLAIVSPSVTLNEVIFMDIPFIAIQTADNQVEMVNYLEDNELPIMRKFSPILLSNKVSHILENAKIINFTELQLHEKEMILAWRNNDCIREWMYTTKKISLQNHLSFIESLKDKVDKKYFLVKKLGEYIGVINFTEITKKSCYFGIYGNPKLKGNGKYLLQTVKQYVFLQLLIEKVYAEVLENNTRAITLYKNNNFIQISSKRMNKKNVICMELKNENR